jgi:hypothetical protein
VEVGVACEAPTPDEAGIATGVDTKSMELLLISIDIFYLLIEQNKAHDLAPLLGLRITIGIEKDNLSRKMKKRAFIFPSVH